MLAYCYYELMVSAFSAWSWVVGDCKKTYDALISELFVVKNDFFVKTIYSVSPKKCHSDSNWNIIIFY